MTMRDGETPDQPLDLHDTLNVQTTDGNEIPFEVVGIVEDPEEHTEYAILMYEGDGENEDEREFIVTDRRGTLIEDDDLAQEILDEFLVFAEEAGDGASG